jgi:hypothetical protein
MVITRAQFHERQVLRSTDLNVEQAYLIGMRRRHNCGPHSWGIVRGLRLSLQDGNLVLSPGVAIDLYGRELVVPAEVQVEDAWLDSVGSPRVAVWLAYARVDLDTAPGGRPDCVPGGYARVREEARLCFTAAPAGAEAQIDPRRPYQVPDTALSFGSQCEPPDDPAVRWPVYLGQACRDDEKTPWRLLPEGDPGYLGDDGCADDKGAPGAHRQEIPKACKGITGPPRPYAGLLGETVTSASRVPGAATSADGPPERALAARMQVGTEQAAGTRFAVEIADKQGAPQERLTIDSAGPIALRGAVRLSRAAPTAPNLYLGEPPVSAKTVPNPAALIAGLRTSPSPFFKLLRAKIPRKAPPALNPWPPLPQPVMDALNSILTDPDLNQRLPLGGRRLRAETWRLLRRPAAARNTPLLNRMLLADLSPDQDQFSAAPGPRGVGWARAIPPPAAAYPWRVYRTTAQEDDATIQQLRVEIGNAGAGGSPRATRLAIGFHKAGKFHPCLTVDAACNVIVPGRLQVNGDVIEAPIPADPADPRFLDLLKQQLQQGLAAAQGAAGGLQATITGLDQAQQGTTWPYQVEVRTTGAAPLIVVDAFESAAIFDGVLPSRQIGQFIPDLPAGGTLTYTATHAPLTPAQGTVAVAVTVVGYGPALNAVYGTARATAPIVKAAP